MNLPTSKASAAVSLATVNEPAGKPGKSAGGAEFSALAQASILIVDDEPGMRNFLVRTLGPRCKHVAEAADTDEASRMLDKSRFDVVILDNIMPGKNGVEWLAEQRAVGFFADAILITAFADLDTAIQALRAGAVDFVLKPFRSNQILNAVARCLDRVRLQRENYVLRYALRASSDRTFLRDNLIGTSPATRSVRETIARVARLPTSILLTGESGTGKEVAARSIHSLSDRADKPFVPVNCAAIPPEMIEAELFGHLKGAFTGADSGREGLFLYAHGGTLFLDEIGELPLPMQSKLLRVLEDRRVRPVGSEREVPVDLRFIFATNADLQKEVRTGPLSGRSVLSPERHADSSAAAEGSRRRRAGTRHDLHDQALDAARHAAGCDRQRGPRRIGELRLAGQCAGVAQSDRTHADPRRVSGRFRRAAERRAGRPPPTVWRIWSAGIFFRC